jgi:hypothetical protein
VGHTIGVGAQRPLSDLEHPAKIGIEGGLKLSGRLDLNRNSSMTITQIPLEISEGSFARSNPKAGAATLLIRRNILDG